MKNVVISQINLVILYYTDSSDSMNKKRPNYLYIFISKIKRPKDMFDICYKNDYSYKINCGTKEIIYFINNYINVFTYFAEGQSFTSLKYHIRFTFIQGGLGFTRQILKISVIKILSNA